MSGFTVIYGIELTFNQLVLIFNIQNYEYETNFDIKMKTLERLEQLDCKHLTIISNKCCTVWLGVELGENIVNNGKQVNLFCDFEKYHFSFMNQLDKIKETFREFQDEYDEEFNKICENNSVIEFYGGMSIYTINK